MLSEIDSLIPMEPKVLPSTRILAFSMQFHNFLVAHVIFIGVQVWDWQSNQLDYILRI